MSSTSTPTPRRVRALAVPLALAAIVQFVEAIALLVWAVAAHIEPTLLPVVANHAVENTASQDFRIATISAVNPLVGAIAVLLIGSAGSAVRAFASAKVAGTVRWIELSLTGPIAVFLIAQLNGISDIAALVSVYALATAGVLFVALIDVQRATMHTMVPFVFGCAIGIVPWGVIAFYQLSASTNELPIFVRIITLSMLTLFFALVANEWATDKALGRWRNPAFGERASLVLSVIAASALAAQLAANC